jgi:hypothetical protein
VSQRVVATLIWSAVALQVALEALSVVFKQLAAPSEAELVGQSVFAVAILGFAAVGGLIFSRRPDHLVGRLFCVMNLGWTINNFAGAYARDALVAHPGALPLGEFASWLFSWPGTLSGGLLALAVLVFPNGRLPSRSWRPVAWIIVIGSLAGAVGTAFAPGPLDDTIGFAVANPLGVGGAIGDLLRVVAGIAMPLFLPFVGAAVVSLFVRLRRARGLERQQLKWFTYALALLALFFLVQLSLFVSFGSFGAMPGWAQGLNAFGILTFELVPPIAAGIAILRYRLYEIDVLINRTLVYGATSGGIAIVFFAGIVVLQALLRPVTSGSELAVAASTLASFALFQPLRGRIQEAVDRRFYRSHYDAARILDAFGARLRDEVDLDAVCTDLVDAVQLTVQPAHASVWLRDGHA